MSLGLDSAIAASCTFCGSPRRSAIDTYKHTWVACDSCGNIVRERKERYLAEKILPTPVSSWLSSTDTRYLRSLRMFFGDRTVRTPEAAYEYYQRDIEQGVENTKYKDQFATYRGLLARYGVDLTEKGVLDISGGPGFLMQAFSKVARRAVMTEFDPAIVRVARDRLGIETVHYDFNVHDIAQTVSGEFDFVFIRYAINFCLDIPEFLASLRRIMRPGGHVFVSFVLPTLGTCLKWQFDDYTYHVLYNPETITRMFAEARFTIVGREDEGRVDYRDGSSWLPRVVFPAYEMKNRLFSDVGAVLRQDNVIHLYRYEP
jgi:SAM-dependent methyltransferase